MNVEDTRAYAIIHGLYYILDCHYPPNFDENGDLVRLKFVKSLDRNLDHFDFLYHLRMLTSLVELDYCFDEDEIIFISPSKGVLVEGIITLREYGVDLESLQKALSEYYSRCFNLGRN